MSFFFIGSALVGQELQFRNASDLLSAEFDGGPICKAFADVNGDYRDDIVRVSNATSLNVDIQSNNGEFFQQFHVDTIIDSWAITVGDLHNDGINEIMTAGNYFNGGLKVYSIGADPQNFAKRQGTPDDFFAQGTNCVDINNDGWLDVFVCDDDGHSEIFINDGTGFLVRDNTVIDMNTIPASDNSGNYASEWVDVDGDNDLDLYIAKCRLGVIDPTSPSRINMLFINEGGTFREAAAEWGVNTGAQSWTGNFGDFDNDGDPDLYIVNHDFRHQFFENIGGSFIETQFMADGSEIFSMSYQSALADFNNDGLLDIMYTGQGDYILLNRGGNKFERVFNPLLGAGAISFALGDGNEDGFIDVIASYRTLGPGLSGQRDRLFFNEGNGNNYVAISLEGTVSNRSGIGAKVSIYGNFGSTGRQTRHMQSGTSYGITNSLTARFGTGAFTEIDSLVIEWPSGVVDVHTDVEVNTHYLAKEQFCINELLQVNATGTRLDCSQDGTVLSVDTEDQLEWSTGEGTSSISVDETGLFDVVSSDGFCDNHGQTIIVRGPEVLGTPLTTVTNNVVLCEGSDPIIIGLRSEDALQWSNGFIANAIQITESGTYYVENSNNCDTILSSAVSVQFVDSALPGEERSLFYREEISLELDGPNESTIWYSDADGMNEIGRGIKFITDPMAVDSVIYFDSQVDITPPAYTGGETIEASLSEENFSFDNVLGSMFFVVLEKCNFKAVTVNANVAGPRFLRIQNFVTLDTIVEKIVEIPQGISEVQLDFILEPGSYEIKLDEQHTIDNFGSRNPELGIIEGDLQFPYFISNLGNISRSLFGRGFFHYFFDWKMEPIIEDVCRTGITPYVLNFSDPVSTAELADFALEIFPNPTSEIINIDSEKVIDQIEIYNSLSQKVWTSFPKSQKTRIDMSAMSNGQYMINVISGDVNVTKQILLTK